MIRSSQFAAAVAAAAMVTLLSAPASAQLGGTPPVQAPAQSNVFQEQQRAYEAEQQRQRAAAEAQVRAMLERDIRVGNMTPAQQEAYTQYAQERIQQAVHITPALASDLRRDANEFIGGASTNMDNNRQALDPANADNVTNRQYSQAVAGAGVEFVTDINNLRLNTVRDLRPVVLDMGAASADIMRERQRIIAGNGVSAEEQQRVQQETQRVTRAVEVLPNRLDQAEYRIRTETQQVRERLPQIEQEIEYNINTYGRDPANIPPGSTSARRYAVPPPSTPPATTPPGPQVNPAPPSPASSGSASSGAVRRGTIPGDPNEGLTVPRSQGGTGPETAESRAAAQSQAQQRAQSQAQANAQTQAENTAARTERLRQEAMARARDDNAPAVQRAPIDQPVPPAANREGRPNEIGTVDPSHARNGEGEDGSDATPGGNGTQSAAAAAGAAIAAATAAMAGNDANAPHAGSATQTETELEYRRRHFGLGRVGASATGGSGSSSAAGDGSPDYEVLASLPGWAGDVPPDMTLEELLAMVERSRVADENYRLFQNTARQNARDTAWNNMVEARFSNGAWDALSGVPVTTLELEAIYANYDIDRSPVIPPMRSLSSAGRSLSAAGTAVVSGFDDYNDPAIQSFYDATRVMTTRRRNPYAPVDFDSTALADEAYNAGNFQVQTDRTGRRGRESGGYIAASLFDHEDPYLRQLTASGRSGLDRLLAQPFNVILTWGANANDLDLHMTGPLGEGISERFHIYYSAPGNLDAQPYAALIKDCICASGSEVVLTSALNRGGVYRVSVFNYDDQSANSTNLANASNAQIQIVRGGITQSAGNGTTIVGGQTILTTLAPNGQFGNTWIAVELDPKNGRITVPRLINQTSNSAGVP